MSDGLAQPEHPGPPGARGAWTSTLQSAVVAKPKPSPTRTPEASPTGGLEAAGAVVSIALAAAAGVLAYRVLRGGRGI